MNASARRGSVYLMTVGTSLIVSCIALASLHSAGVLRRASRDASDADQAHRLAWAGLELAQQSIDQNPNWRSQWQSNQTRRQELVRGGISVSVTDPIDGQLTNLRQDPIRIRATGERGSAQQSLEWTLAADDWLYPGANSAIYAEHGILFGPGRYTSNRWAFSAGRIESSHQSTVQMNCLAAQGCNGGGFRWRAAAGGRWPMAVPNLSPQADDYIGRPYIEIGTPLSADDLPTGGVSLIANSHFEAPQLLLGWRAYLANLTTVTDPVYSGARSAGAVATQLNIYAGPYHPVTADLVNGHTYRLGMWIRSNEVQFITPKINAWVNGGSVGTTFSQFSYLIMPGQWRYIAPEIRVSWGGRLDYAEVQIQSDRNKEYFFDEVTLVDLDREAGSRYIEQTVLAPNLNPYRPDATSTERRLRARCGGGSRRHSQRTDSWHLGGAQRTPGRTRRRRAVAAGHRPSPDIDHRR
jgi:hypothetical protein